MEALGAIPGYAYGSDELERSPVTDDDLALLKQTVLFDDEDERHLRMAGEVLRDQVEAVLDVWYGFVASHPHLVRYFAGPDGAPIDTYLARVRARFGQWVHDLCEISTAGPCRCSSSRPGTRPTAVCLSHSARRRLVRPGPNSTRSRWPSRGTTPS